MYRCRFICFIFAALVGLLLISPFQVMAKGNIHFGKLKVIPGLNYKLENNDNIFLDPAGEKDDFISTISPSLSLDFTQDQKNYIKLGYNVDVVRYHDFSDTNYEKHSLTGRARYTSPVGWYANAWNYFVDTEDPYGSLNDYNIGEQTARWNNTFRFRTGYRLADKTRMEFSYRNFVQNYDAFADEWQNKLGHEPGLAFFYKFWPKTSALFEYRYQLREYTEQQDLADNDKGIDSNTAQDFSYHKFYVGLQWDATAKINGNLKLGYGLKDYDNSTNWLGEDYDDNSTWIAETRLSYQLAPKTRLTSELLREVRDSSSNDGSTEYENTRLGIGVKQTLLRRFTLKANASYTAKDYDADRFGNSREDDQYRAKLGCDYKIQDWLTAGVAYTYEDRQSNFADEEYTNNIIGFHIGGEY